MRKIILAVAVLGALLVVPAVASADYTITRAQASYNARDAARTLYGPSYGITFNGTVARCGPQSTNYNPNYTFHRWVCGWAGRDYDGDVATGALLITGQSDGTYGYRVWRGIRWN
jgi:hypothetical protein